MKRRLRLAASACAVSIGSLLFAPSGANASSTYAIRDLGADVGDLQLNNKGTVAGSRFGLPGLFLDRGGQVTALDSPLKPLHLSSDDRVIGVSRSYDFFPTRGGLHEHESVSSPTAANDLGWIAGTTEFFHPLPSGDTDIHQGTGFLHKIVDHNDGVMYKGDGYDVSLFSEYSGTTSVIPKAINNSGVVAGSLVQETKTVVDGQTHYQWTTDAFRGHEDLAPLLGGTWSEAQAINDRGDVAGYSYAKGAFLIHDGKVTSMGPMNGPFGAGGPLAMGGMNNLDQVVGRANVWDGVPYHTHAIFYDPVKQSLLDLNILLPVGSGWDLTDAVQINDAGQIVGYGTYRGVRHGFLLTPGGEPIPVPEPAAWAVLLVSVVGYRLASGRRSRRVGGGVVYDAQPTGTGGDRRGLFRNFDGLDRWVARRGIDASTHPTGWMG